MVTGSEKSIMHYLVVAGIGLREGFVCNSEAHFARQHWRHKYTEAFLKKDNFVIKSTPDNFFFYGQFFRAHPKMNLGKIVAHCSAAGC